MVKIIAEFCQNHNGSRDIMAQMVEEAKQAGATYAKLQNIFVENLTFRPQFENGLFRNNRTISIKRPYKDEYERLKLLELNEEIVSEFLEKCKKVDLIPMTTCFVRSDVKKLYEIGFRSIKVASYDCASYPMLREISRFNWEVIISTGATFDKEIEQTANILKDIPYSFLHCITIYPTPLDKLNLKRMNWLERFTHTVGFSDHTLVGKDGIKASLAAIFFGAKIIERHFTVLPQDQTKDGPVSINKDDLQRLVEFSKLSKTEQKSYIDKHIPELLSMLGTETRTLSEEELLNRDYYRGRFASINKESNEPSHMIFNWEETPLE